MKIIHERYPRFETLIIQAENRNRKIQINATNYKYPFEYVTFDVKIEDAMVELIGDECLKVEKHLVTYMYLGEAAWKRFVKIREYVMRMKQDENAEKNCRRRETQ